jgi:hypothetical protein
MASPADPVVAWLLEGDPAIRWQVFRGLLGRPGASVARQQACVAREGWGARLLDLQSSDGRWKGLYSPKWTSTTYTLLLLKALGLPPHNSGARVGALILLNEGLHRDNGINFWKRLRRNSETCVTAMVLGIASRFAPADDRKERLVEYLLDQQMPDGGWNCLQDRGATHSSLHTTILALEGLLEYEASGGAAQASAEPARHDTALTSSCTRINCIVRIALASVIDERMTRFSFPPQWHYDVLRGLDYLALAGAQSDHRAASAIGLLRNRRGKDGRWNLQNVHKGRYHFMMEQPGEPSRWNTLRALRVLRWWGSGNNCE